MALLAAKRHGSLFDLALHHWKQPIENMFAVQALKLWSPKPGTSSEAVRGQEDCTVYWPRPLAGRHVAIRIRDLGAVVIIRDGQQPLLAAEG
jgi:hypothetical protein